MNKVTIYEFADPMMGLAWECLPTLRKLEERYGSHVELREVMVVLVRDVSDFMTSDELALPPEEGLRAYNARLATIYESEESIGGMPIVMDGFALFAPDRRTSRPLCLAYEAAKLTDLSQAADFLYRLRRATVMEGVATTKPEELKRLAEEAGIDVAEFERHLTDGTAAQALADDMAFARSVGVHGLPAFMVEGDARSVMLPGVPSLGRFEEAISRASDGSVIPISD